MGNYMYAETLIGMTIPRAERFVKENNVYHNPDDCKFRVDEIRNREGFVTMDYCRTRLNVKTNNGIIVEIVDMG